MLHNFFLNQQNKKNYAIKDIYKSYEKQKSPFYHNISFPKQNGQCKILIYSNSKHILMSYNHTSKQTKNKFFKIQNNTQKKHQKKTKKTNQKRNSQDSFTTNQLHKNTQFTTTNH